MKILLQCLMLRRTKSSIHIPSRRDISCSLEFRSDEFALYESVRKRALQTLDDASLDSIDSSASYLSVLQQINSLRMISNLGIHYRPVKDRKTLKQEGNLDWTVQLAQQYADNLLLLGRISCYCCETMSNDLGETSTPRSESAGSCENLSSNPGMPAGASDCQMCLSRCRQLLCSIVFARSLLRAAIPQFVPRTPSSYLMRVGMLRSMVPRTQSTVLFCLPRSKHS